MKWYRLQVGIEHLTTGLFFYGIKSRNGIQFEMESTSTFNVWSDEPFSCMWPAHDNNPHQEAILDEKGPDSMRCSWARAQYAAKVVAPAMQTAWELKDTNGEVIPRVVADALIRKFGAEPMPPINRGYPYYWFTYAGMFHGIEPDGSIHT